MQFAFEHKKTHEYVKKELQFLLSYYYDEFNDESANTMFDKMLAEADLKRVEGFAPSVTFIVPPHVEDTSTLNEWCRNNTTCKWGKLDSARFWWFEHDSDAVAFYLAWC